AELEPDARDEPNGGYVPIHRPHVAARARVVPDESDAAVGHPRREALVHARRVRSHRAWYGRPRPTVPRPGSVGGSPRPGPDGELPRHVGSAAWETASR